MQLLFKGSYYSRCGFYSNRYSIAYTCEDLCQIIRDYLQSFGKGCRIIRRAEFLEEVWYEPLAKIFASDSFVVYSIQRILASEYVEHVRYIVMQCHKFLVQNVCE